MLRALCGKMTGLHSSQKIRSRFGLDKTCQSLRIRIGRIQKPKVGLLMKTATLFLTRGQTLLCVNDYMLPGSSNVAKRLWPII